MKVKCQGDFPCRLAFRAMPTDYTKTAHHTHRTMRGSISYTLSKLIPNDSCILINGTIIYIRNLNTVICMDNLAVTHINCYVVYHTGL